MNNTKVFLFIFTFFFINDGISQTFKPIMISGELERDFVHKEELVEILSKEVDECCISSFYKIIFKFNKWFIFSKDNYSVIVYDKNVDTKLVEFGSKGRGPGEGEFIHSFEVTPKYILIFDSFNKNINFFNHQGEFHFKLNSKDITPYFFAKSKAPTHINDIHYLKEDMFLLSGVNEAGLLNIQKGLPYQNLFFVKLSRNKAKILNSESIIQKNILKAIEDQDIISSTLTSPFKFSNSSDDKIYLFNYYSNEIIGIKINENDIIRNRSEYILDRDIFSLYDEISKNAILDKKKFENWSNSGENLIQLYLIKDFIFFIKSRKKSENNNIIFEIIKYSKESEKIVSSVEVNDRIINIDNNFNIHTFGFDLSKDKYVYRVMNYASN